MAGIDLNTKYDQLNERSRWYSSQIWYVPFAYIGLLGLGLEKVLQLAPPLRSVALVFLGIFSLSTFIHVTGLRYYERRTVRSMQEVEGKPISGGGSPWYLSFAWYIKAALIFATYALFIFAILDLQLMPKLMWTALSITMIILIILTVVILAEDSKRSKALLQEIRRGTH